jgi:hypothetical protein
MKKHTQKAGFKFRLPWKKNTLQRDLSYVKTPLLDRIFLKLCTKKEEEVKLNNTKRKGILYKACKTIYKDKFKTPQPELKVNQQQLNLNKKANERAKELLDLYYKNRGKVPPTPKPIFNLNLKHQKPPSPYYNGL